ncbi:unnamed protein product [Polarella glacialis]|uniref:Uncharacterized protein n=1 Tax=Polarella glacialis TaxID=89957 RepID=A0A813EDY1_POLGL|nr:unnamed protein product [Polarella glacialis]
MTVRCLRPEWLRFALVVALQLVLCQQGTDGKIMADGMSADSCPGLESKPFREISELLEHSQIRVDFFDHFYPKVMAVPDANSSCALPMMSIYLYSYFVTCNPAYSGRVSDMSKTAFPCWGAGTFLEGPLIYQQFLESELGCHRWIPCPGGLSALQLLAGSVAPAAWDESGRL